MLEKTGRLPDVVVAAVGGGSNAIGMFHPFVDDASVRIIGVEAAGTGEPGCYNPRQSTLGTPGVLHGQMTMPLQTKDGQIEPSHSVSAGLDLSRRRTGARLPERHWGVHYGLANDASALDAFQTSAAPEGILPALESSHALGGYSGTTVSFPQEGMSSSTSRGAATRTWTSWSNICISHDSDVSRN